MPLKEKIGSFLNCALPFPKLALRSSKKKFLRPSTENDVTVPFF
jgi:hypothetical protein